MKFQRFVLVVAAVAVAVAVAACGSSGGNSNSTSSQGSTAKGTPVKIGIFTDDGSAVSYPSIGPSAEAAAAYINAHGGLANHPVVVDQCNAGVDPNLAAQCARKFVQDGVVAIAGNSALADAAATPVLDAAKIPEVTVTPRAPQTLASKYDFETGSPAEVLYAVDAAYAVKKLGLKLSILVEQSTAGLGFAQLLSGLLKGYGIPIAGTIEASPTAASYAPFVATAQSEHATGILALVPAAQLEEFSSAAAATGASFKYFEEFPFGTADVGSAAVNSLYSAYSLPPLNVATKSGVMAAFVSGMKAQHYNLQEDADGNEGFLAFWGFYVVQQLVEQEHLKSVTASSLETALNSAKDLKFPGFIPPWTPSTPSAPALAKIALTTRVSNPYLWLTGNKNGKPVLLQPKEVDAIDALKGNFGG